MDTFIQREPNGSKQFDVLAFFVKALILVGFVLGFSADIITIATFLAGCFMR